MSASNDRETRTFIGTNELRRRFYDQLGIFEEWARNSDWLAFHHHHYDWWMFPIDEISSHDAVYQLTAEAMTELFHDDQFIQDLRRGVRLMVTSWGWDIEHQRLFSNRHKDQKWSYWPVRLYKAGKCMWLFEQDDYYQSLKIYAQRIKLGKHNYNDEDRKQNDKDTPEKLDFFSHTRNSKADVLEAWESMEKSRS